MLFVLFANLFISRSVLKSLGVVDYGIYNVVAGFVSIFAFMNSSMSIGIQRFYNYEKGKGNEQSFNEVIRHISQLDLPDGVQPKKYINHILTKYIEDQNTEIVSLAKSIIEPDDSHKNLDDIIDGLGDEDNVGLYNYRRTSQTSRMELLYRVCT